MMMKQMIFINTSVQPERFCFVSLTSTEQQNSFRGWALRDLHAPQRTWLQLPPADYGSHRFPKRNARGHVTPGTDYQSCSPATAALWTQGNPPRRALTAVHKPSHLCRLRSQKGGTGLRQTYGHWQPEVSEGGSFSHFQTLMSPSMRFSKLTLPSPDPARSCRQPRSPRKSEHRSAGLWGWRTPSARLNRRFSTA